MTTPTTFTYVALDPIQLGNATGDVLTDVGSLGNDVEYIELVNDTTTAATATLYYVPSGGSAGDDNIICKDIVVPSDGVPVRLGRRFMEPSSKIRGLASAATQVTVHAGYTKWD